LSEQELEKLKKLEEIQERKDDLRNEIDKINSFVPVSLYVRFILGILFIIVLPLTFFIICIVATGLSLLFVVFIFSSYCCSIK
jgi:uncharacterized membrane protein